MCRKMTKMSRHSLPPGRLKMAQGSLCPGQCFSIIVLLIVTVINVSTATATTMPSDRDEQPLIARTTTPSDLVVNSSIVPSPTAPHSLVPVAVPGHTTQKHQGTVTKVLKTNDGKTSGGDGGVLLEPTRRADTISNTPVKRRRTTASGDGQSRLSSGTAEAETTSGRTTTKADETELYPQNDQPGRFGQQQEKDTVDDGLGSSGGGGGYYHGNNKMSNGMLDGANSQQPQDKHLIGSADAFGGKGSTEMDIQCPSLKENSACPCYKFDDGLVLECPGTTAFSLRTTLQLITAPIQSLSVYDFDRSVTTLTPDVFSGGKLNIRHLQFSQSHLEVVVDNAFRTISNSLESLSLVNGKLTRIPQRAILGMDRLTMIDLEANEIQEVGAESFAGLHLAKLNLKSNRIASLQPNAFKGVEMTLSEVDLSDNKLQSFPLGVLRQLDNLRTLRLALNEMSALLWDGHTKLPSLQFLDLSTNKFTELGEHFFQPFAKCKTLSLYSNALHLIHYNAFQSLKELVSVDISHNHLITLDRSVFEGNKKLQTIDLSHNHLHYVDDMFTNLPYLREVFLSDNNILELSRDVFTNSTKITNIYLEQNAIRRMDGSLLDSMKNLQQLFLSNSFISAINKDIFRATTELTTLSLDSNWLEVVEKGLFHNLNKLRELRLHGNRINQIRKNIFHPLPALVELHLQNNLIASIESDAFSSLTSLLHLNLQNNKLQRLDVLLPHSLNSIQFDSNQLTGVGDAVWREHKQLQVVWLGNNQLTSLQRGLFSDLASVERLYLPNNSIESLNADMFKEMVGLRVLDLSGNSLTEIKRSHFSPHLIQLEELVLRGNRIQTIEIRSFEKLKKLRILDLSGNFLMTLAKDMFQDDLQINKIDLQGSRVGHIEPGTFRSMNNLYDLNLEDNQLKAEDVRQLEVPSLRMLRLSNNMELGSSTDLNHIFDKLPSLQILRMANCNIHELPELIFMRNTNLVRIELGQNRLRTLARSIFTGLNVLKELRLTENQLSEFPHHALFSIPGLETLAMSQNHLTSIDFSKLNGMPSVRHLDLSSNLISSMSGFSGMNVTQLEFVDLGGNYLLALPSNFFPNSINLQRIDLSRNRFQHIPSNALGDSSLPRLSWLNVSGNPLNVFYDTQAQQAPVRFSYLKELYIRHTNLTIVTSQDFQAYPALQQLLMTHNRINRISPGAFNSLRSLLTLDISVNELEKVPKERMQGLKLLRTLNLSHNVLKELDEFPEDLRELRELDLSFNQLSKLSKTVLRNLANLNEFHLVGNRLKTVAGEAFRNVHQLQFLDLRQNYFEHIPLTAIQVVEAHLKALRIEDNPIQCSCDTQELWEWLRNHLKLILPPMNHHGNGHLPSRSDSGSNMGSLNANGKTGIRLADGDATRNREFLGDERFAVADGTGASEFFSSHLRCDQPAKLRGRILMEMEPHRFCDAPLILKVAIQDIQPYSVHVSWQTREHSGLHGYHVVYRSMEDGGDSNEVRSVTLDRWAKTAKLFKLAPGTQYQICVVGIANIWDHSTPISADLAQSLSSTSYYYSPAPADSRFGVRSSEHSALEALLRNNVTSKCDEVVTLDADSLMMDEHGMVATSFIQSLLTRRLGLIVGCCLGIIVFIVLIFVLGWLKVKKQRILEETKRMEPHPPDFISYQPYSISHEDQNMVLQTGVDIGQNSFGGNAHHSYQQQGCGGNGRSGVYIPRSEFATPLLLPPANAAEDGGGGLRMQSS